MRNTIKGHSLLLVLYCIFLGGCQPKVYLMPSPVGLEPGGEWFDLTEDNKDDNLLYTLYATIRQRFDKTTKSSKYSIEAATGQALSLLIICCNSKKV